MHNVRGLTNLCALSVLCNGVDPRTTKSTKNTKDTFHTTTRLTTFFEPLDLELDQAKAQPCCFQIRDHMGLVNWSELVHRHTLRLCVLCVLRG